MTTQIVNMDLNATLKQLLALGQKHPNFNSVHLTPRVSILDGSLFQDVEGAIFLKDNTMISSGFCKTSEEMFSKIQSVLASMGVKLETTQPVALKVSHSIYATARQKEQIIKLLNHPYITRQEKTKLLLNINRLESENADKVIEKLKKLIEERKEEKVSA